jgi:hypothetical protein
MVKMTFYPLGNADCCLIDLQNGKKVLFDFGAQRDPEDEKDKRIDLPAKLREDMDDADKKSYEVLAITHLDDDHTCRADEFFYLDHAACYQSDDRFKIDVLWVPAGVITESRNELCAGAKAIQAEARYRLKKNYGIRIFSRPVAINQWLEDNGLKLEDRQHLITDAGNLAPELTLANDGVEFFVHSPFGWRQDACTVIDRNRNSLVMQATFDCSGIQTKAFLGSDVAYDAISDIVMTTKKHKREERLEWDIFKLPHHCSYKTIGPERGRDKTVPEADVKVLFEEKSNEGCIIVSPNKPIPIKGTEEDNADQPPHRQAKNYYVEDVVNPKDGEFRVTMEHPSVSHPQPLVIEIRSSGASLLKRISVGAPAVTTRPAPRAG